MIASKDRLILFLTIDGVSLAAMKLLVAPNNNKVGNLAACKELRAKPQNFATRIFLT
jgi:hypothetical protein